MTEFETQLLQHLQNQAEQLTNISEQQAKQAQQLTAISAQQVQILAALSNPPEGDSIVSSLEKLLQPLVGALGDLSRRLPEPSSK